MKCGVHNFYHNFCNAAGGNDTAFLQSMVIDELTKLIADRQTDVNNALIAAGAKINKNASIKETTTCVLNNLNKNIVQKNIALLILQNNNIRTSSKLYSADVVQFLNADGVTATNIKDTLKDKDAFTEVTNTLNGIAESFNGPTGAQTKKEIEKDILDSINDTPSATFAFGKVFKFVAVASILSFASYKIYKFYKNKKA